jgi:hypothetical protein
MRSPRVGVVLACLSGAVALSAAGLWAASDIASLTYRAAHRGGSLEVSSAEGRLWLKRDAAVHPEAVESGFVLDCPSCVVNDVYAERRAPAAEGSGPRELAGFYLGSGSAARVIGVPLWSLVLVFSVWPGACLIRTARKKGLRA